MGRSVSAPRALDEAGQEARTGLARDAVAIGLGVGVYGLTFGILADAAGATLLQAVALSALTFTGASQIALVGVLQAGGSPAAALGSAMLLAARNGVYGLALAPVMRGSRRRRALAAHLVIDEPTAMAMAQPDPQRAERAFWMTGAAVFAFWNGGTLVGTLAGQSLGDPARLGLDTAFPAAFLALLVPQLDRPAARVAAIAGAMIALAAIPLSPPGAPVLLAALGVAPAWLALRRREQRQ